MQKNLLLALGGLLTVACSQSTDPSQAASRNSSGTGGLAVTGIVYGYTAAPDSQRTEIAGATVTLSWIGDLPPETPGPDSTLRSGLAALVDTIVPPGDPGTPPGGCGQGDDRGTAVTGADGKWTLADIEQGVYQIRVVPPEADPMRTVVFCGIEVRSDRENAFTLYVPPAPQP